jgi:hypothetical protein
MTKNESQNNTKLIITLIVSVLILIAVVAFGTYAFFTGRFTDRNPSDSNSSMVAGNIEFTMEDGSIIGNNLVPGDSVEKKFTVHNKGTGTVSYNILWTSAVNNFINQNDLIVTLKEGTTDVITESDQVIFPSTITTSQILKKGLKISAGETKEFTLTITYKNTNSDQTADMGKGISAVLGLGD